MAKGLDFSVGARRVHRWARWQRRLAALLLLAVLAAFVRRYGPGLAGRALSVPHWLAAQAAPLFTARLDALQAENFALHTQLAAALPLQAENQALRTLLHSERAAPGGWLAGRVIARGPDTLTLYCADGAPLPGAAVVDARGRYAGCVQQTQDAAVTVALPGAPGCLAGDWVGVLTARGGAWSLTGLPAAAADALAPGTAVTTLGGQWVGVLAAAPTLDPAGLTATAALADTAGLWGSVYFVAGAGVP